MRMFKLLQPRLNYSFSFKEKMIALCSLFSKSTMNSSLVSSLLGSENIYFFDHARSGLQLVLSLLPPNSKVGVQPLTCPTVLEAIEKGQCIVSFIDINDSLVIDKHCIENSFENIDAFILTHTFGCPVGDMNEIKALMSGKLIIEDCAHAFLSMNGSELVGKSGDIAIFSHGFAKFPSAIQGGYVLLNNLQYTVAFNNILKTISAPSVKDSVLCLMKAVLLSFSNNIFIYSTITSKIKETRRLKFNFTKPVYFNKTIKLGFKTNRAVLENQLLRIEDKLENQQNNGIQIMEALQKNSSFKVCQQNPCQNYFMIPVLVKNPDHFISFAALRGIEIGRHFVQSAQIIPHFGYQHGSCPNYEKIVENLVTIPAHYNYPKRKLNCLISIIKDYSNE